MAAWANSASALAVFLPASQLVEMARGERDLPASCPAAQDGTTLTLTGDCTDGDGVFWSGTATVDRTGDDLLVTLADYGSDSDGDEPAGVTGTWELSATGAESYAFVATYEQGGLVTLDVDYDGSIARTGEVIVWNGSGTVERGGFTDATGTVEATTVDQRRDPDLCTNQSASGTTTLVQKKHTVEITYDGATDCDDAQSAQFSVDGGPSRSVDGVSCSHTGASRVGWGLLARHR